MSETNEEIIDRLSNQAAFQAQHIKNMEERELAYKSDLHHLRRMVAWVPCEDRLPEDNRQVLIYTNFGDMFTCRLPVILQKNNREKPKHGECERVTHWMEMPIKPIKQQG